MKGNWNTARTVVTNEKARAAILPFDHFNIPSLDRRLKYVVIMPTKYDYLNPKNLRQIRLASFLLKCLVRATFARRRYVRDY